ncbi:MAG TPA: hypothetical protein DCM21_07080 [Butyrivibrio sp.]|nr:hypothetical protein [Butyrivibrio sp.]
MAEMKDSDIRWIGQIPKNWKVIRVKDAFTRKKAKAKQENPVILSLARSGVKVRDITNNEGQLAENYSDYNPVMVDDLLLNPMDLISGDNCNISRVEGVISPAYVNLRYKNGINPEFYNFYFKYQYWCKAFFAYGKGVSFENRWTLNYDTLERFPLILPPIEEQNRIVKFLKGKCAEIDALHTDIEKQIETLEEYKKSIITEAVTKGLDPDVEMKDSGIEWVGMIPKHWNVTKFKYICSVKTNLVNVKKYQEYPQISPDNIEKDSGILLNYSTVAEAGVISDNHLFFKGQILYSKIRPKLNKVTIAPFNGLCSADMYPIETNENTMFVMYMILSQYFLNQVSLVTEDRVKMPKINQEELGVIKIVLPDNINEQEKIVLYLHQKCQDISKAIEEKKEQLETLEQYKKSLIYEYVTGKKEVK